MSKSGLQYKRKLRESKNIAGVPPTPSVSEPNPEGPPPNIPVPGVPMPGSNTQLFSCPVCGAVFSSEEELQLHTATEHP